MLAAAAAVAPLAGLLLRGAIQTQRVGPGAAHPEITRVTNPRQSRRSFMRWATLGALAVAGAEFTIVFIRFFWPNKTEAFGSEIIAARRDNLPAVGAPPLKNDPGRFYLLQNEDGLMAFYWKCTHLGCTVPWDESGKQFNCPCHGSLFDRRGLVIGGPAPRPMDLMEIKIQGDNIIVNTGKIIQRADFNPSQVTKL
jgi:cytochrome b6-f complex iron-sulfur subunit